MGSMDSLLPIYASKGSYIFSAPAMEKTINTPISECAIQFNCQKSDTYFGLGKVKSPTVDNQSYFVYDVRQMFTWEAGIHAQWTWVKLSDASTGAVASFALEGLNELQMAWGDDNVQIDQILITNDAHCAGRTRKRQSNRVFPNLSLINSRYNTTLP